MNIESRILGTLKQDEFDTDLFICNSVKIPYFGFKEINTGIHFAHLKTELEGAENTIEKFLTLNLDNRNKDSETVFKYYEQVLKSGYTENLNISELKNIWNFVRPSEITVSSEENGKFYVYISCGCQWEEEHGLQLVYENGEKLIRASGHE